jgi:ABC-type transport system involved in multi-copper enzyme maturation permease subunit
VTTDTSALRRKEAVYPLRGFGGVLGRELRVWFPWRWLILTAAGFGVFALVYLPWAATSANLLGPLLYFFFGLWLVVMLLAVVSLTEGSVLGEIDNGTAAWMAALPIARPSIILAKFVAAAAGITAIVFTVGLVVYPVLDSASQRGVTEFSRDRLAETLAAPIGMWGAFTTLPELGDWVVILAAVAMLLSFVAALMMLLGTLLSSRSLVFGLGLVIVGAFGALAVAGSAAEASPAGLIGGIVDALQDKPFDLGAPLLATALWILVVLLLAVWRFNRRELA